MHVKFSQARAEADAISPLSRQIGKDTERLPQQWASRLIIAARTALEVHRSTARNRTHLIHVDFEYELGHAEWADRFFFHSAKVVTFAEAGDTYASEFDKEGTELWRDRLEFARAQVNSAEGKTIFYTTFYTRYTSESNSRCDTSCASTR